MSAILLDAGNTRLKWALCERGQFLQRGVFTYEWPMLHAQFDEHWGALAQMGAIEKLVLCNVVGDSLATALQQWLDDNGLGGNETRALQEVGCLTIENVVAQSQAFGVQCAYRQAAQLGADRWAALVAARQLITGASCVIDCGTALTIDVLTAEGVHAGGLIAPGMAMMRQSLLANTAQIDVEDAVDSSIFSAQDTASAVQAGIMASMAGAVQQVLQQCREQGQQALTCVVTGGDAQRLLPVLPKGTLHEPEWILKGLAIIAGCHE